MKTSGEIIVDIKTASKENDMMKLISIHDELLDTNISVVTRAIGYLKRNDEISYTVFKSAATLSKVNKNGVFKAIIENSLKREIPDV